MLQLEATVTGANREDLELALDEIMRRVAEGDAGGENSNGVGVYKFLMRDMCHSARKST